ncbi:MAG: transglutaminase family protein [Proteobacteria bacterium]|nr:transglutaminase family protein [Pseudomonadota bacterium]
MLLQITHETHYAYTPPVETAQHLAHLRPLCSASQELLEHRIEIRPAPAQRSDSADAYGNARTFFALESTHEELSVVAHSLVRTSTPAPPGEAEREVPWEQVRERFRYRKGNSYDAAAEFVFPSRYVPRHSDFGDYARASFTPGRPLFDAAFELTQRMFGDFIYDGDSTEISTPAVQALAQRRGVCQDFAHIMIGCLRTLGLPARYVSGYLLTQPAPGQDRLVGADASHAWVSAYLPGAQGTGMWVDFDPTNGRQPGEDYVALAVGRDFADVSPMRGVLHGGARHTLKVGVTVQPVQGLDDAQPPVA